MSILPTDFERLKVSLPYSEQWRLDLLNAAQRIQTRGHAKHTLCNRKTGAVCALGAYDDYHMIDEGRTSHNCASDEGWARLYKYLGEDIINWNNAPERTAQEVVDTMISAALS